MPFDGFLRRSSEGNNIPRTPLLTYADEQVVAQGFPPYAEMARRNLGWQVMNTSAVAALVVRPSTAALATLYNNNTSASQIALIIDRIFAFNLVTTAALSDFSVWACIHPTGRAADTADITAFKSTSGKAGSYAGGAIFDNGATVTDDGWFPVSLTPNVIHGVGVTPSHALAIPVDGRFVVPPTAAISIHVVASIVGLTFTGGFSFFETKLPMGDGS